ncbi:MAG: RNA-directed DNA polymerase [Bacteroides sp.]|nr:RNA-directed DNA polymerase [Bacteroides sp.]
MKRYGFLFDRICDYDNLVAAAEHASDGKSEHKSVRAFYDNFEDNIQALRQELITGTYKTSDYEVFVKYEPKERLISKLPFRDRVLQWAIALIVGEIWERTYIRDTYAGIKKRGVHDLKRRLEASLHKDPEGTVYGLQIDIQKYYHSIDHQILKRILREKLKDQRLLELLDGIVDSVPGDVGIPIGNYMSTFFANLYLSELDHLLKEVYGVRYYYRYSDDMVLLAGNKPQLHSWRVTIINYLKEKRKLTVKPNHQVFPVESRGIDVVGYLVYEKYSRIRKETKKRLCRKLAKLRKQGVPEPKIRHLMAGNLGGLVHCNSNHLLKVIRMENVKKFSQVGANVGIDGPKIDVEAIFGKNIIITNYHLGTSKHNGKPMIKLQFLLETETTGPEGTKEKKWEKHIIFNQSVGLIETIKSIDRDNLPFKAKIVLQGSAHFLTDPDD